MTLAIGALCPEGAVLLADSIRGWATPAGWAITLDGPKFTYLHGRRAAVIFSGENLELGVLGDMATLAGVVDTHCGAHRAIVAIAAGYDDEADEFACQLVTRPKPDESARKLTDPSIEVVGLAAQWWSMQPPVAVPNDLNHLRGVVVEIGRRFVDAVNAGETIHVPAETKDGNVGPEIPYASGSLEDWATGRSPNMPLVAYPLRMVTFAPSGIFYEQLGAMPLGIFSPAPFAGAYVDSPNVRLL